jgi:A/G-specific adenine glycosylase
MNSRDTTALLEWYNKEKRDLPWRNTNDPYAIWLSEVILQQTRVDQGMAYYHKLLGHYPSVNDLANAHQDEVLSLWQGLGYYSRGRNLHATAKKIQELGNFPSTYTSLLELKGIGPYTAAAIASFAFNERVAVLDGNVFRVITRFLASNLPIDKGTTRKTFQSLLNGWIPAHAPADFNQAMMELGATVCSPKSPKCLECPLANNCKAFSYATVFNFPVKASKTKVEPLFLYYAAIETPSGYIVKKRPERGVWAGLYDFPFVESKIPMSEEEVLLEFQERFPSTQNTTWKKDSFYTHELSHRKISAQFFSCLCRNMPDEFPSTKTTEQLLNTGISALLMKYVKEIHI